MAITNKERIGRALDLLREGLYPFVEFIPNYSIAFTAIGRV